MPDVQGQHAVVAGASMAGLLASRVLSSHFERVTVLERDAVVDDAVVAWRVLRAS